MSLRHQMIDKTNEGWISDYCSDKICGLGTDRLQGAHRNLRLDGVDRFYHHVPNRDANLNHAACNKHKGLLFLNDQQPTLFYMAFKLHIPPCICTPAHPQHPPPPDKPLRFQIEGPLIAI
ncbi:hypothetical protein HD806DRAFT_462369 [Xylariaceae sp. AK1471]|nr:hypothetical protein HD806DRAFT_462369 [Xylariaceae sp. AK1471]